MKPTKRIVDPDGPLIELATVLMALFIVAIFLQGCRTGQLNTKDFMPPQTPTTIRSNPIPADLRICRDTNGPIDYRTWK